MKPPVDSKHGETDRRKSTPTHEEIEERGSNTALYRVLCYCYYFGIKRHSTFFMIDPEPSSKLRPEPWRDTDRRSLQEDHDSVE